MSEKDEKDGEGIVVGPPVTDKPVDTNPKPNPDKPETDKDDDVVDKPLPGTGSNGEMPVK